jgi:hypothetical protein
VRGGGGTWGAALLEALAAGLAARLGPGHRVLPPAAEPDGDARFTVEASVHAVAGRLETAFVLRDGDTGATVTTLREGVDPGAEAAAAAALAGRLVEVAWAHVALPSAVTPAPTDLPLHLRLHAAALLMDATGEAWRANEARIAELRAADPADPWLAMVWAMHRFGQVTLDAEPLDAQTHAAFCDEIEGLVLGALPAVRDDPVMALAAAKLLIGGRHGHEDLAEALAASAFAGSAAFAAAFPMLGQIKACRGDLAEGVRLFDEGLTLCVPGSQFESYIQVLKASTLVAAQDWPAVEAVYDRLAEISPQGLGAFSLAFLPPDDEGLARRLAPLADRLSLEQARRMVAYLHYRVGRYFRVEAHAANAMRGPLVHLVRRFGPSVVSDAIWRETPRELQYLRRPAPAAAAS